MTVRRQSHVDPKTGIKKERWIVDIVFEHPNGTTERVRKTSPVRTRKGAEEYERSLRIEMLTAPKEKVEVMRYDNFIKDRWWPTYPSAAGNRQATITEKEHHLRLYIVPFFGSMLLTEIRKESIDRFFAFLAKPRPGKKVKVLSAKSIRNVQTTFRKSLVSACEWELIPSVPKMGKIKVPDAKWDFYTREESELLLGSARNAEERLLLLFALRTGCRAGEQIALEWGDLDFVNHLVVVRQSSVLGEVGPTKSGKHRKIPMAPDLVQGLKAGKHLKGSLVFSNPDGSPYSKFQLHERLEAVARLAGLRRIKWHELRHSFATQVAGAGVSLRQLQVWLGHSTIVMTERYAHHCPSNGADLIAALSPSTPGTRTAHGKERI